MAGCGGDEPRTETRETAAVGRARQADVIDPACVTIQRAGAGGTVYDTQIVDTTSAEVSKYGVSWTINSGLIGAVPAERQALLRFELDAIPAGVSITSADVTLWQTNNAAATVGVHPILAPWDEATVTWASFGGAFDPGLVGSFVNGPVNNNIQAPTPVSFALDTALVQGWLDGWIDNHGILLEQPLSGVERTTYRTSEWQPASQRPALTVCYDAACPEGFASCDGDPQNGCETWLDSDTDCGACGNACSVAHGTGMCAAGACAVGACDDGWSDCNGDPGDGCETPLDTTSDCGACGAACTLPNATAACVAGSCTMVACDPGFDDCDGDPGSGCETPLDVPWSCGACWLECWDGDECTSDVCAAGQCVYEPAADGSACWGGVCAGGVCDTSSCTDGIKNQGEEEIDCGGPCAPCNSCITTSGYYGWLGYLVVDAQGTVTVADSDNNQVLRVTTDGQVTVFGSGVYGHQDGPADTAMFAYPMSVALDAGGDVFVADADNSVIRKIAADGTVSTVAGVPGVYDHQDGPAATARFRWPTDVEIDPQGGLFILDYDDNTVRKLSASGQVTTVAGAPDTWGHVDGPAGSARFSSPSGMTRDAQGNLYVTEWNNADIRKIDVNGNVTTVAGVPGSWGSEDGPVATATFDGPRDLVVDAQGDLLVMSYSGTIRKVSGGVVSTIAGAPYSPSFNDGCATNQPLGYPAGIGIEPGGAVRFSDGWMLRRLGLGACDCSQPTCFDHIQNQGELGVDCEGPCYTACPSCFDGTRNQGEIDTDCGGPCPLCGAGTSCTQDGACDSAVCAGGFCQEATCTDGVQNQGETGVDCEGPCPDACPTCLDGIRNQDETGIDCGGVCDPCPPTCTDGLQNQGEEGVDCGGPCDACPTCNDGLQNQGELDADCGGPCPLCGAGTACTQGAACDSGVCGGDQCQEAGCGDGVQNQGETGVDCGGPCAACSTCLTSFPDPYGMMLGGELGYLAVDALGDVVVPDMDNNVVYRVSADGHVTRYGSGDWGHQDGPASSAMFARPQAVAVDADRNVFVADAENNVVRKIALDGTVTTVAGVPGWWGSGDGPASSATFSWITDLEVDAQGNVFIVDSDVGTIRKLDTSGEVTTVAGDPWSSGHQDGPARWALFRGLAGITRDALGNLYVSERSGRFIRKIDLVAGQVSTVAGTGQRGALDGPAAAARFDAPADLVVDAQGNLLVADRGSATLRKIAPNGVVSTLYGSAYTEASIDGCAGSLPLEAPRAIGVAPGGALCFTEGTLLRRIGLGACDCSAPTCFDHTQNQGEQGIDCEGPCDAPCPSCSDGIQNGGELDVDCGGACPLCAVGMPCTVGPACESGVCGDGECRRASCADGVRNQGELDADCGGPCPLCQPGAACTVDAGCLSDRCVAGTCTTSSCSDGIKNQGEVDTDCGGPCQLCAAGTPCTSGAACGSGVCTSGICQSPTCQDGVQNGGEIDADCGGDCDLCPVGKHCVAGADCQSGVCQLDVCRPATCANGVADAGETDVDCGGPCGGCAAGKACVVAMDCAAGRCAGNVCNPPPVPSAIDPTLVTDVGASTAFLYEGPNAVQLGVTPGAIDVRRVAVVRGRVLDRSGAPIPDVTVSALDHPDVGRTATRADGAFDLAVNGGGIVKLHYGKPGLLPAQRQITAPVVDYVAAPDVVMIALDPIVTTVDLENAADTQVAAGSVAMDADGARRATAMFEPGTVAEMVLPDGTRRALTSISVRASEFTVGDSGPKAMPGELPTSSGYTYAVEMSVDQAFLADAREVRFSKPVAVYVDNFLGFPTGEVVPVGHYDRRRGEWVASDNGRIVEIVSITAGRADLDIDGSGAAASPAALAALGVTDGEREKLAADHAPGKSLWRSPFNHFTAWDCNWPYGPPQDAAPPPPPPPKKPDPECPNGAAGSIIECETQVLSEEIPIAGTPFRLEYSTKTMAGRDANRTAVIGVTGATVPASLKRIELHITVAGQTTIAQIATAPNQTYRFTWDGKDGYGRPVYGTVRPTAILKYVYPAVYYPATDEIYRAFSQFRGYYVSNGMVYSANAIGGRYTSELTLEEPLHLEEMRGDDPSKLFGLWGLDVHRTLDRGVGGTIAKLDEPRTVLRIESVIRTEAGGGEYGTPLRGDGGPATEARTDNARGTATGADGSLYIAEDGLVRRVGRDGIISTVAGCDNDPDRCDGTWTSEDCEECGGTYWSFEPRGTEHCSASTGGCDALRVTPWGINDVAVAPDGTLYASSSNGAIYRITPTGTLTVIAGTPGEWGFAGDGGPAVDARLSPASMALGRDGSLYIADSSARRVRRIGPDGLITTIVGNGGAGQTGDGGLAVGAAIGTPWSIAAGPDGSVYIASISDTGQGAIRRVSPEGLIKTVAGNGQPWPWYYGFFADPPDYTGAAATAVPIAPHRVTVGADGIVYFDTGWRVYRVAADGKLVNVAGTGKRGNWDNEGDGGRAVSANLYDPITGLSVNAEGRLFIASNYRVRSVGPWEVTPVPAPPSWGYTNVQFMPSGEVVYAFDDMGRHIKTLDWLTGNLIYDFRYDSAGRLITVVGARGEETWIVRDASGAPTAIVGPGGVETTLAFTSDGRLSAVNGPGGASAQMTYTAGGLLSTFTDRRALLHTFTYDATGALVKDESPSGGFTTLSRVEVPDGFEVTTSTALGRVRRYRVEEPADGRSVRTVVDERGGVTQTVTAIDGTITLTTPEGTRTVTSFAPDPIWGMTEPYVSQRVVQLADGRSSTITRSLSAELSANAMVGGVSRTDTTSWGGQTWTKVYDGPTSTLTVTSPGETRQTVTTWDGYGHMLSRARVDASTGATVATTFGYDAAGLLASLTGAEGTRSFTYDAAYRVASTTDALGHTTAFTYDPSGRPASATDANGVVTAFTYDAEGRVLARTFAGETTQYTYDARGNLASEVMHDGTTTQYAYDLDGRYIGKIDGAGNSSVLTLDPAGNPSREDLHDAGAVLRNTVQRTFDAANRPIQTTTGAGQVTSYGYGWGAIESVTDGLGHRKTFVYDATSTLQQVTDAANQSTYYAFDDVARTQTITDARGASTSYDHDGLDQLVSLASPHAGTTSFGYDGAGRKASRVDARGVVTSYGHDAAGRVTSLAYSSGAPGVVLSYDQGLFGKGKLTGIAEGAQATSLTYDASGRVTLERTTIGGVTWSTSTAYDGAGRVASLTLSPGGAQVIYTRDAAGRVIGVTANDGSSSRALVTGVDHLPFGPVRAWTFGNGVAVTRVFDKDYRLTRFVAGSLVDRSYGYDAAGDLTAIVDALDAGNDQVFGYDVVRRLTSATGAFGIETYGYDAVGNRTQITRNGAADVYSYPGVGQRLAGISGAAPEAYAYDAAGNATTVGDLALTYDHSGRLASASAGGQLLARYESSVLGRRVRKTDANGSVTVYLYDGQNLLATADGAGNLIEQHVYVAGTRVAVLRRGSVAAADVSYVVNDHRGATEMLLDQGGQVVWRGSYRPFGEVSVSVAAVANDMRLPGQLHDAETGLHDNWLRAYDPHTGRYLQSDPIGLDGGINTYIYVDNSPLLWADPLGLGKISASAYGGLGGGGSISWDSGGFSICGEFGLGVGSSVEFSPDAGAEPSKVVVEASAKAGLGPLGAEGKIGVEKTKCGARGKITGKANAGPLALEQTKSADLFDWNNPKTEWENNASLKPGDWNPANWLKASSEAKVSAGGCKNFKW